MHVHSGGLSPRYHSIVSPGSSITHALADSETQNPGWSRINPQFPLKQSGNLRRIIHIKVSTAEQTHWIGFYLSACLSLCPKCSICGGSDRWIALPPQRWMYRCTQLVLRNNVITPIHSHVMLAPPANHETKIPLSLLSLFTLSAHRSVETQYHSSVMHVVATETAADSLLQPGPLHCWLIVSIGAKFFPFRPER